MQIELWQVLVFMVLSWLAIGGAFWLGLWAGFRTKTMGSGLTLTQPTDKDDGESYHYIDKSLMGDIKEAMTLAEEPLSDAARRIREQKSGIPVPNVEGN